ncbi:hypothetical protein H4J57_18660 [Colwellia sp. BRX8-7]|jgi:hypothetical protein|uniref:hypothetical protein n=1 Tax=unclassified Colwellia TaxID=196834 RepID=UPI0015F575E3|nr:MULTISPECIES: hypothetical protein [unclassified Colwellia]MBA6339215.1 hypothetical protein [Colwellia sp. BRX8-7]MBA6350383.1 hypothetical protein [Colwellia sp. BRX8-9]
MKNKISVLSTLAMVSFCNLAQADDQPSVINFNKQQQQIEKLQSELRQLSLAVSSTSHKDQLNYSAIKNWHITSYGSVLYKTEDVFRNTQDTQPQKRSITDVERVVLEFGYRFDPQWQVEIELEYEHGGTGAALEYDGFEEFGEFETEIEAGGEVLVEKLELKYAYNDYFAIKLGRIFVPVGLGTELHKPDQYFTTQRHWSESTLIPQVWHETGINFTANWQGLKAQALLTTGLNSEYFRTYRWVASGHQKRFETINADDLALTLRVDYGDLKKGSGIGASFYSGNTSGNRNNTNNISADGHLSIIGLNGVYRYQDWTLRGQYLFGKLDDSLAITAANKTTPGLKPGNFAQLGSEAESAFLEVAYNSQFLLGLSKPLYLFTSYDYANPIKEVAGGLATSRFDIKEIAIGVNYIPIKNVVLKAQFAEKTYAQNNLDNTQSFSLSMGYYFSI